MIPAVIAAVVSVVVIVIGGVTISVARQQRSSRNDLIRTLSISAVVFGTVATFLIFCLSPETIRPTLTCVTYVLTVFGIAALVTCVVLQPDIYRQRNLFD
jgi:hypothetical protein